ncbi:MAG TPA: hypothetical protein VGN72_04675 [Tepidisphaeraceae bacterium]|jgi:hypothetical protein|nr:hypothetical protein [Tepidisphaeraceae bacterium]
MSESITRYLEPREDRKNKLRVRPRLVWRVIAIAILVGVVCTAIPALRTPEWVFGWLAVVGAVAAFFFNQHATETVHFIELFEKFNDRYDRMNEELRAISQKRDTLTGRDRAKVVDYFNLCAEEFLFFDAGYIDERVWNAWRAGMASYGRSAAIREVWEQERVDGSYYGFEFPVSRDG